MYSRCRSYSSYSDENGTLVPSIEPTNSIISNMEAKSKTEKNKDNKQVKPKEKIKKEYHKLSCNQQIKYF